MLRDKLYCLYQCPQYVLRMSDDICASVNVGCYFKVQWHSLGQHKLSIVFFTAFAPWPAVSQLHLFTQGFFPWSTSEDKPRGQECWPLICVLSRLQRGKICSSSQTLLQVAMLFHKALSVSDLKQRRKRERDKQWVYFHRLTKHDGQHFIQQALTMFVYACRSEFACTLPKRVASCC